MKKKNDYKEYGMDLQDQIVALVREIETLILDFCKRSPKISTDPKKVSMIFLATGKLLLLIAIDKAKIVWDLKELKKVVKKFYKQAIKKSKRKEKKWQQQN